MVGSRAIMSTGLAVIWIVISVHALTASRLTSLGGAALFWIGCLATIAGPLIVRFWRIHQRSSFCFRYSYDDRQWEDEAHFLRAGRHRITIGENDGDAFDLPPAVQYGIYIGIMFIIGLLTIDGRAVSLLRKLPNKLTVANSQFCPDPNAMKEVKPQEEPGCALVRRAFELGYAKSLGSCEQTEDEKQEEICRLRQRDEPLLHYAWRLLARSYGALKERATTDELERIQAGFIGKLDHLEELYSSQQQTMSTGARASHQIWTNLPSPESRFHTATDGAFARGNCIDRYRHLPNRPKLDNSDARLSSKILDHVFGKLLFEPRYSPAAGYCREYKIHWDAPPDACERLVAEPEKFLRERTPGARWRW